MGSRAVVLMAVLAGLAGLAPTGCRRAGPGLVYSAVLTGGDEVPPVRTRARAELELLPVNGKGDLRYRLAVTDVEDAVMAHLHMAEPGRNGEVVARLYPPGPGWRLKAGRFSGTLAEGVLSSADLVGPMRGRSMTELADEIAAGRIYVHVHTRANREGGIRGQVR